MNAKKKVLLVEVVEDQETLRESLSESLDEAGYHVISAKNGAEGLEQALNNHPDLILLDIVMPNTDGITMLKHLRDDKWGKDADVILLTNIDAMDKLSEALEHGVRDYVVKADTKLEDIVSRVKDRLS